MNFASEDIKDMLAAEPSSLGLTFGTNLFIGREPAKPNNCVTIYDTTSYAPDMTMDPEVLYHNSSVQIRIRNLDYTEAMDLGMAIMTSLYVRAQETWNGTLYTVIKATGEPALLAWDDSNRAIIIINFDMQRR